MRLLPLVEVLNLLRLQRLLRRPSATEVDEAEAAATCARVADDAVKARLRKALATLEAAFHDEDPQQLYAATTDFYQVIFAAAGHDIAWEVVQRLNGRISRLRALTPRLRTSPSSRL